MFKSSKLDYKKSSKSAKKRKAPFNISGFEILDNYNIINEPEHDLNDLDEPKERDIKKSKKKAIKMEDEIKLELIDGETEKETRVKKKKHKKSKKKSLLDDLDIKLEDDSCNVSQLKESSRTCNKSTKCIKEESNWEEFVHDSAKNRLHEIKTGPYKPGNLSDLLQIKKYGRVILPYDPSFGLDPKYQIPEWNDADVPKVHINPLFDLSKRKCNTKLGGGKGGTVFVGNLPSNTRVRDLNKIFNNCGPHVTKKLRAINAKVKPGVKQEPDEQSMYTKIVFESEAGSKAALELNGMVYKGRHLRINLASNEQTNRTNLTVFVGNLAFDVQDDDLWKCFERCGDIESVRVVRDRLSGRGKGYGFVNFVSSDSVATALKLDGSNMMGRDLRVTRHQAGADSLSNAEHVKRRHKKRRRHNKPHADDSTNTQQNGNKLKRKSQDSKVEEEDVPPPKKQKKKKAKNKKKISINEESVE